MVANALALLTVLLTCAAAQAAPQTPPLPKEGSYVYSGDLQVNIKLQYRVVYGFTDAGQAELAARRKAGETCSNTGREIYLCRSFGNTEGAADLVRSQVAKELAETTLTLGVLRGEPSLIRQGTDVAEYQVSQEASLGAKTYATYRLVNAQGSWSIRLGEPTEAQLNLDLDGGLAMPLSVPLTSSHEAYDVYGISAGFAPKAP